MEWSDAKTLQLIKLYEKRPCDKVAACNWTVAAHATLSRDFVARSHDKIARENFRCDIGLTFVYPTQRVETFGNIFFSAVYLGHPLTSLQNFTEIVPGKPLCLGR